MKGCCVVLSRGLDRYFAKSEPKEKRRKIEKREVPSSEKDDSVVEDLWSILQETVQSMILYPHHLNYTRTKILPQEPSITPEELATRLSVPLGVALVILDRLHSEEETEE